MALQNASAMLSEKPVTTPPPAQILTTADRNTLDFLNGTTINMFLDGYYAYNFNDPIGRANLLRAYDVSRNAFSINQADLIIEHAPDPANGKRLGARIDLQYGQATETLQGNPANEARPEIYTAISFRLTVRMSFRPVMVLQSISESGRAPWESKATIPRTRSTTRAPIGSITCLFTTPVYGQLMLSRRVSLRATGW